MELKVYFEEDHRIDPQLIDSDALFVINKLQDAGFIAYLVGGSVRDLLTKRRPKDFDICTSALPEQIKSLFRGSCLLIGRRFRLAHIRFGKNVLEVSTFRAGDPTEAELITRDNLWGTPEEDVLRRDLTINGLFYDPKHRCVIDYVGGWEDIQSKSLKTIGEPSTRFIQDPVRMLRIVKFQARLGFSIEEKALEALTCCRQEILKSSPARILEEFLRMLESGASAPFFKLLSEYKLLDHLLPSLDRFLTSSKGEEIYRFLEVIDKVHREAAPKTLERPVLVACLLFPLLEQAIEEEYLSQGHQPHFGEIALTTGSVLKEALSSLTHFPRRLSSLVSFALSTQYRFTPFRGKKAVRHKIMHNNEFRFALHFLKIRAILDDNLKENYLSWRNAYRQVQHQSDKQPRRSREPKRGAPRRRRPRGK